MAQDLIIPPEIQEFFGEEGEGLSLIERCLVALTMQPGALKVRVFLSKLYYLNGYFEFAIRELNEVKKYGDFPVLDRILRELGTVGGGSKSPGIVAEVKFQ